MKYLAYDRTSTQKQHLDRGINEIMVFCQNNNIELFKNKVYTDKMTGKHFNRPNYEVVREILEPGDALIITEVDRLGRDKNEIMKQLSYYKENNIRVMILEIPTTLVDISEKDGELAHLIIGTINNVLTDVFASLAQEEMIKKKKRQREGIEAKKKRGEWEDYGRPRRMEYEKFRKEYRRVKDGKIRPFQLMKELGLTRSTFYRYKKQYDNENGIAQEERQKEE